MVLYLDELSIIIVIIIIIIIIFMQGIYTYIPETNYVPRELLLLLLSSSSSTAIELSLGGSSPYTSTDKTNKNKYT